MTCRRPAGTPSGDMSDSPKPATPAPGAAGKLDRLRALLREMFQLDRGDLDFGLYRIMNLKSAEIGAFLDNDLLPQVKEKLRLTSDEERARLEKDLEEARGAAWKLGVDPDSNPPPAIVKLNRRLAEMQKDADAEADVYNHLATFFGRYYAEGDFISQRRYTGGGRAAYLIPYDGEEVKLHWANAYGVYDLTHDAGWVSVGVDHDTADLHLHAYVLSVTPPDRIGDELRPRDSWERGGVYFLNDADCFPKLIRNALGG